MASNKLALKLLINAKDRASSVFAKLRSNAGKVAGAIVGYFGVRFFKSAIDDAQAFEKQMDTVAAVSNATAGDLKKLEQAAKEMGATTQFTSLESARALESLARAGLSASEQIQALPEVLSLAQANGIALGESASFITKAIAGMGLQFSDAGRVADVLTKAAASANTSVVGLGSGLSYAAPLAQALGLSLESTVSYLAQLANAGIDASRAGTSLNAMMVQFQNPASKFRKELGNLGIKTDDFNLALKQLAEKGDDGKAAILALGTEAGPALQALLNQGMPALEALQQGLNDSAGAAKKAADTMSDNLAGFKRQFGSVVDAIKLQLAQPFLEPLKNAIKSVNNTLQEMAASGELQKIAQNISNFFVGIGKSLKTTVGFVTEYSTAIKHFAIAIAGIKLSQFAKELLVVGQGYVKNAFAARQSSQAIQQESIASQQNLRIKAQVAILQAKTSKGLIEETRLQVALATTEKQRALAINGLSAAINKYKLAASEAKVANAALSASMVSAVPSVGKMEKAFNAVNAAIGAFIAYDIGKSIGNWASQFEIVRLAGVRIAEAFTLALTGIEAMFTGASFSERWEEVKKIHREYNQIAESTTNAALKSQQIISQAEQQKAIVVAQSEQIQQKEFEKTGQAFTSLTGVIQNKAQQIGSAVNGIKVSPLEKAFRDLGVTSSKSLQQAAENAKANFQLIKNSGEASAADIANSWIASAEKSIAANGGVLDKSLEVELQQYKVAIAADKTGTQLAEAYKKALPAIDAFIKKQIEAEDAVNNNGGGDNDKYKYNGGSQQSSSDGPGYNDPNDLSRQKRRDRLDDRAEKEWSKDGRRETGYSSQNFNALQHSQYAELSAKNQDEFANKLQAAMLETSSRAAGFQGRDATSKSIDFILQGLLKKQADQARYQEDRNRQVEERPVYKSGSKTVNVNLSLDGKEAKGSFPDNASTAAFLEQIKRAGLTSA